MLMSNSMPVTVNARFHVRKEDLGHVLELFAQIAEKTRNEPGTLAYQFFQNPQDPSDLFVYEKYATEADRVRRRSQSYFQDLGQQQLVPLFESQWSEILSGQ
jgi:quinol monooxygenase YgiN